MSNPWTGACVLKWTDQRCIFYGNGSVKYRLYGVMLHNRDPFISVITVNKLGVAYCDDCQTMLPKPSDVLIHIAEHDVTRPGPRASNCYGAEEQIFEWLRLMGEDSFEVIKEKAIHHEHSVRHRIRY